MTTSLRSLAHRVARLDVLEDRRLLSVAPEFLGDLNPVSLSSNASNYVAVGDVALFTAEDPQHGRELWRTDGTAAGTVLLKDIWPGPNWGMQNNELRFTAVVGDVVYFPAIDAQSGQELWRSDGTEAGTYRVKDIWAGPDAGLADLEHSAVVGDTLYFAAHDGKSGRELWKTDGSEAGTVRVRDISPDGSYSDPRWFKAFGDALYFVADDGQHGRELWKSDGTAEGTALVKDVNPFGDGPRDYSYSSRNSGQKGPSLTESNGRLFFVADDGEHGVELWSTDGTEAGTNLVKDIASPDSGSSAPWFLQAVGDQLLFFAQDGEHGRELWRSDGTAQGTRLVRDINQFGGAYPRQVTVAGGLLYFPADHGELGRELWRSDGTPEGTLLVKDIDPNGSGYPKQMQAVGNALYFTASDQTHGRELWRTDGTPEGSALVKDLNPGGGSYPSFVGRAGPGAERLIFLAQDETGTLRLWATDGSVAGTQLLGGSIQQLGASGVTLGERLIFSADDGKQGMEPWSTDGTREGTKLLADVASATADSSARDYVQFQGAAYFTAYDNAQGWGLYRHDPEVPAGATLVKRVGAIDRLRVFGDKLLFVAGSQLWASDGTEAGTQQLKETGQSIISNLLPVGNELFFGTQNALWKTDGTPAGTQSIRVGFGGVLELAAAGGTVFFAASGELWRSDGTRNGTIRVKDIAPGGNLSDPRSLIAVGDQLYFTANDGEHGRELWKSDGTADGAARQRPSSWFWVVEPR
ncbi:MAG: ELWxxDGT repeat protein [Pirellulales bacterium]